MYRPQGGESFVIIQVKEEEDYDLQQVPQTRVSSFSPPKLNFSAMKLFDRFRKIVMRFVFSLPSRGSPSSSSQATAVGTSVPRRRSCDRPEPPKTSCSSSSYYSSSSHYNEAIADCIEFFNKSSSQEGMLFGRKSDVVV